MGRRKRSRKKRTARKEARSRKKKPGKGAAPAGERAEKPAPTTKSESGFLRRHLVKLLCLIGVAILGALLYFLLPRYFNPVVPVVSPEDPLAAEILGAYRAGRQYDPLKVLYPLDETLFPADIVAPTFRWEDEQGSDTWVVTFTFPDGKDPLRFRTDEREKFTPSEQ